MWPNLKITKEMEENRLRIEMVLKLLQAKTDSDRKLADDMNSHSKAKSIEGNKNSKVAHTRLRCSHLKSEGDDVALWFKCTKNYVSSKNWRKSN